jgi:hydroxyacyl-ACP dehydratase HTD2-like protein with hotdog domain
MTSLRQFTPGAACAPRAYEPSTVQCFLFSAATWNSHRIHYDESYATGAEGHGGVLVPGPLQGAFLEQFLSARLGADGDIERLQYRNTSPVVAGTPLWCEAEVEQVQDHDGGPTVVFKVWLHRQDGTVTTKGRAWVRPAQKR